VESQQDAPSDERHAFKISLHGEAIGFGSGPTRSFATRKASINAIAFINSNASFFNDYCTCTRGTKRKRISEVHEEYPIEQEKTSDVNEEYWIEEEKILDVNEEYSIEQSHHVNETSPTHFNQTTRKNKHIRFE
jgi:hypothetical protein